MEQITQELLFDAEIYLGKCDHKLRKAISRFGCAWQIRSLSRNRELNEPTTKRLPAKVR
jgi:hypothetical protein